MARRSTPPTSPQRPSLARHRSEVDRLLAAQILAGKDIQQKYVGSHLYLVSNKPLPMTKFPTITIAPLMHS